MRRRGGSRISRIAVRLATIGGMLALLGALGFGWVWSRRPRPPRERFAIVDVRRSNIYPTVTATGQIDTSRKTRIECQLENVSVGIRGNRLSASGASTLLSVIPEGSTVKKGDVLAVLDSSDYEELLRLQEITVERAKADKLQAELDHEIAKLAVREFKEGTMQETIEDFEGKISLARSDLERAMDRATWSGRMKEKGYAPTSMVKSDEFRRDQMALSVEQEQAAFEVFKKYTVPKTIRELEGEVKGADAILQYQELRLQRNLDRLGMLKHQVEFCTIRAPHDGFVIYANNPRRQIVIEPGIPVRQHQDLLYLPDLSQMQVVAMLHESIVEQVRKGQRARVHVEGFPKLELSGQVTSIAPLATSDWWSDVRYFQGIVKLEKIPGGIRPGMSAQVEIAMPQRENVLTVPSEAVALNDGHDVCFVVHEDGLERRPVKLGQVTRDMTEVTEGLREGEQVVLHPGAEAAELETSPMSADVAASDTSSNRRSTDGGVFAALQ